MRGLAPMIVAAMMVGLVLTASSNATAWSADVALTPAEIEPGGVQSINIAVTDTWILSYTIESVNVTIDWPGGPVNQSASGTPCAVQPGISCFPYLSVNVPAPSNGTAIYHAFITVTASDHQNATYSDIYVLSITVRPWTPHNGGDGDGGFLSFFSSIMTWLFLLAIVIFVVVLLVALGRRKKRRARSRTPPR